MCADEQDVFAKVNADLEQVACETCVKDNTAMVEREVTVAEKANHETVVRGVVQNIGLDSFIDDLSSTSGSMHQQRTSGQAGKDEREKNKMEEREDGEKVEVRRMEERKSQGEGVERGNGKHQEREKTRRVPCAQTSYCYTATKATCKDLSGCLVGILPGGVVEFTDVSTACNSALKPAFVQQPVFVAIETDIVSTVLIWCIDLFMRLGSRSW